MVEKIPGHTMRVCAQAIPEKVVPLSNGQDAVICESNITHKSTATRILRSGSFVTFFVSDFTRLGFAAEDGEDLIAGVDFFDSFVSLTFFGFLDGLRVVDFLG